MAVADSRADALVTMGFPAALERPYPGPPCASSGNSRFPPTAAEITAARGRAFKALLSGARDMSCSGVSFFKNSSVASRSKSSMVYGMANAESRCQGVALPTARSTSTSTCQAVPAKYCVQGHAEMRPGIAIFPPQKARADRGHCRAPLSLFCAAWRPPSEGRRGLQAARQFVSCHRDQQQHLSYVRRQLKVSLASAGVHDWGITLMSADFRQARDRGAVRRRQDRRRRGEGIKKELYADGQIDKKEVEFLIDLRNAAQKKAKGEPLSTAFENLFFKAIQDNVLDDGAISTKEAGWACGKMSVRR